MMQHINLQTQNRGASELQPILRDSIPSSFDFGNRPLNPGPSRKLRHEVLVFFRDTRRQTQRFRPGRPMNLSNRYAHGHRQSRKLNSGPIIADRGAAPLGAHAHAATSASVASGQPTHPTLNEIPLTTVVERPPLTAGNFNAEQKSANATKLGSAQYRRSDNCVASKRLRIIVSFVRR
jgi:hypothetical protein